MAALTKEETEALIQEVLEVYPEQARTDNLISTASEFL